MVGFESKVSMKQHICTLLRPQRKDGGFLLCSDFYLINTEVRLSQEHHWRHYFWHKKLPLEVTATGYRLAPVKRCVQMPLMVLALEPVSLIRSPAAASFAALAVFS